MTSSTGTFASLDPLVSREKEPSFPAPVHPRSGVVKHESTIRERSRIVNRYFLDSSGPLTYKKFMAKKRKNQAAVALGRKGGLKGGPARAAKLGKEKLSEAGRKAVEARWARYRAEKAAGEKK